LREELFIFKESFELSCLALVQAVTRLSNSNAAFRETYNLSPAVFLVYIYISPAGVTTGSTRSQVKQRE
jgi:hypothetical protein